MTDEWFRYEQDRRAEVTVFSFGAVRARTGAKGTRFFKKHVEMRADARAVVSDALDRMPSVRARWPQQTWPRPSGLQPDEHEIVLPALMLAAGRSEDEVDRIARSRGEPI